MADGTENAMFAVRPHQLTRHQFLTQFGGIYEHSQWVAEAVLADGLGPDDDRISHLGRRMAAIVDDAGNERQSALLRAHPELAGKLAIDGGLTSESTAEQASAGLDRCSPEEFAEFQMLNKAYGQRFGHPFIIAVRGLTRADILAAFRRRIDNDETIEFASALAEVHKIARLRLDMLAG